jgi:hypothetical protein
MRVWPALALEQQHVLAEVVRQSDDSKRRARRHHSAIVASVGCGRPSSAGSARTLYKRCHFGRAAAYLTLSPRHLYAIRPMLDRNLVLVM